MLQWLPAGQLQASISRWDALSSAMLWLGFKRFAGLCTLRATLPMSCRQSVCAVMQQQEKQSPACSLQQEALKVVE